MKIVHLANTPLSCAPYNLMTVQQEAGHDSRLISHRATYSPHSSVVFPTDVLLQSDRTNREKRQAPDFRREEVYDLIRNADVLHCHNFIDDLHIWRFFPELKKELGKKLVALQFHSPRLSLGNAGKDIKNNEVDVRMVVAQYQVRQFPECTPVPNALPIFDEPYKMVDRDNDPPLVAYSPSNTNLRDWNNKGYASTVRALKSLKGYIQFDIITNTPYLECLKRKQQADIVIDECVTGSYHLCTLEGLSHGQVVINNMDDLCDEQVKRFTGGYVMPIVKADINELKDKLKNIAQCKGIIKPFQSKARQFIEAAWNPHKVAMYYKHVYEGRIKWSTK